MSTEQIHPQDSFHLALAELSKLRQFAGAPGEFWPAFLRCTATVAGASLAVLAVRKGEATDPWQKLAQWSSNGQSDSPSIMFNQKLRLIAEDCARQGTLVQCLDGVGRSSSKPFALAVRLEFAQRNDTSVAAFLLPGVSEPEARESLRRLQLTADAPNSYLASQLIEQAKHEAERFATVLDLMVQVNGEQRYVAAALTLCNGLAARHHCDRVSLGWFENGFIRLQAMSLTEKFDRQMAAAKALEAAMEEALDQDEEILWPAAEGSTAVARDHEQYARAQSVKYLCSVPLRIEGTVTGVLTCERQAAPFTESEVRQLRLACDQAVRRMADLKRLDRWFGARLVASARERLGRWVGVEHTWTKTLVALTAVGILAMLIVRPHYRVESKCILRSDHLAYSTAPFDGFIDEVPVRVGEAVKVDQPLLSLDRKDLFLEESGAIADLGRYTREAEKARAANALADMRIAQALADEAAAHLNLIRYRIGQAVLKAPFAGVVAEGDQRERVGAPVKQGEVLFKIAQPNTLYVEAEVQERDIHEIKNGALGEIAFVSQPKLKFPIRVVLIEAAAQPKEGANVFLVRCALTGPQEPWWRPGMTGVGKLEVGRRPLLWILTHRTVDYLRLLLWW